MCVVLTLFIQYPLHIYVCSLLVSLRTCMWAPTTLSQHLPESAEAKRAQAEKAQKPQFLHQPQLAGCVVWCLQDCNPPPPSFSPPPIFLLSKLPLFPLVNISKRMSIIWPSCLLKTKPPPDKTPAQDSDRREHVTWNSSAAAKTNYCAHLRLICVLF